MSKNKNWGTKKYRSPRLGLGGALLLAATASHAGTMTVNSLVDPGMSNGQCELREAVVAANTNTANPDCPVTGGALGAGPGVVDIINFAGSGTYLVTAGELATSDDIRFNESGQTPTLDAQGNNRMINNSAVLTLTDITFTNGAADGVAGAIRNGADATLTVNGGTVINNVAATNGGGFWNGVNATMMINGVTITNNRANGSAESQGGGGLFNEGGTLTISESTITGNSAPGTADDNTTGINGSGGGIWNGGGMLGVSESTISNNSAVRAGGGIEDDSRGAATPGEVILVDVIMDGNETGPMPGNGGAVHITGGGTMSIAGGEFSNNIAASEGGGLWNSDTSTMTIVGAGIFGNQARGAAADNGGGGLFNNGGVVEITGSFVTENTASNGVDSGDGAGAASGGGILNLGELTVTGSLFGGNTSQRAGGAIEAAGTGSFTSLTRSALVQNTTGPNPGNGGGLHITGDNDADLAFTLVVENTAAAEGGGLWNSQGAMFVDNSSILSNIASGNDADQGGGGIFNQAGGGTLEVLGSRISGNIANGTAGSGGGIFNDQGAEAIVLASEISANSANRAGGGIENTGMLFLTDIALGGDSIDFANTAGNNPGNGGGLHNGGSGEVEIVGSSIGFNMAAEGGGLWNSAGGTMVVDNSTVSNNSASGDGGGVYQVGGGNRSLLRFATVANNSAGGNGGGLGVGVAATNTAFGVTDSIVAGNTAAGMDDDFAAATTDFDATTSVTGDGSDLGEYRLFGGFSATHPLLAGSAAIDRADAGACASIADNSDQRDADRPGGDSSECDSGAFEVAGNPVINVTNTNTSPVTIGLDNENVVVLGLTLTNNQPAAVTVGGFSGPVNINSAGAITIDTANYTLLRDSNGNGRIDAGEPAENASVNVTEGFFEVTIDGGAGISLAAEGGSQSYLVVANPTTSAANNTVALPVVFAGGTLLSLLGLFSVGGLRRRTRWLLAIVVVSAGLTACGSSGDANGFFSDILDQSAPGNGPIQGSVQFVAVALDQPNTAFANDFLVGDGLPVRGPAITINPPTE